MSTFRYFSPYAARQLLNWYWSVKRWLKGKEASP